MKNTIKKIGYGIAATLVLATPVIALAQLDVGNVGTQTELAGTSIVTLVQNIIKWLLYIVGFLAVLAFIIAGVMYLTSGGDETRMEKAKKAMIAAIIGIVVALLGLIIVTAVNQYLYGSNVKF